MAREKDPLPMITDVFEPEDFEHFGETELAEKRREEQIIDVTYSQVPLDAERTTKTDYDEGVNLPKIPSMRVLRAYQDYFDLGGGRTIAELCRRYRKTSELYGREAVPTISLPVLHKWKRYYDWDIQVRADELDLYEQARATKKESAKKMVERQTGYARVAQTIGYNFLRSMLDDAGNLTEEGKKFLTPAEARRLILDGSKLEMDLYGGSREVTDSGDDEISYE